MFALYTPNLEPITDEFRCVVDAHTIAEAFALRDRFTMTWGDIIVLDTSTGHRIPAPVPHHATGEDPASDE